MLELQELENLLSELGTSFQKWYGIPHSAGLVQLRTGVPNRPTQRPSGMEDSGIAERCGFLQPRSGREGDGASEDVERFLESLRVGSGERGSSKGK